MLTLKAFGDESADGSKRRAFAVAAVLGTEDEWSPAIREWLRRTRGLPFHANRCESEYANDPDPQKHKDNLKLYEDLTQILARSHLVGFAVALNLETYHDVFEDAHPDWAYFKALADLVRTAASTARRHNSSSVGLEVRLDFTFDSRIESDGTAGIMYQTLTRQPEFAGVLDTDIRFESGSGKSPRLEMGDLLARESMKELDRRITQARPNVRGARRALEDSGKFVFIEHDRDYWEELKVAAETSLHLRDEWDEWLIHRGRVQDGRPARTLANWFLFNAWMDAKDGQSSALIQDELVP